MPTSANITSEQYKTAMFNQCRRAIRVEDESLRTAWYNNVYSVLEHEGVEVNEESYQIFKTSTEDYINYLNDNNLITGEDIHGDANFSQAYQQYWGTAFSAIGITTSVSKTDQTATFVFTYPDGVTDEFILSDGSSPAPCEMNIRFNSTLNYAERIKDFWSIEPDENTPPLNELSGCRASYVVNWGEGGLYWNYIPEDYSIEFYGRGQLKMSTANFTSNSNGMGLGAVTTAIYGAGVESLPANGLNWGSAGQTITVVFLHGESDKIVLPSKLTSIGSTSSIYTLNIYSDNKIIKDAVQAFKTNPSTSVFDADNVVNLYPLSSWGQEPFEPSPEKKSWVSFNSEEPFSLKTSNLSKNWNGVLYYSYNLEDWNEWLGEKIEAVEGEEKFQIFLRGEGNTYITGELKTAASWILEGNEIYCEGNLENVLDFNQVLQDIHPTMESYCFSSLFLRNSSLITPPDLPSTVLAEACYESMFYECINLAKSPTLPALELEKECYNSMFMGCQSLIYPPLDLPAAVVTEGAYKAMFSGCSSLVTTPEFWFESVENNGCLSMFEDCVNLEKSFDILATSIGYQGIAKMFYGCEKIATPPSLPFTTLGERGCWATFFNCINLIKLPKLYSISLSLDCYQNMFYGCKKIKLSTSSSGDYVNQYRIPFSGTGSFQEGSSAISGMFKETGGNIQEVALNTLYYTSNLVVD